MTAIHVPAGGTRLVRRLSAIPAARRLVATSSRLLDRATERGIERLSAISLALFGLSQAGSLILFPGRYWKSASLEVVFSVAHPLVWAALFAITSLTLLAGASTGKAFTAGACLGLSAVHTFYGVLTIPAFLFGDGLPTAFLQFAGNGVWCLITFLLWRLRIRTRG